MTADDDLRRAAEAALADFIYEHGSEGFEAMRAALAARSEPHRNPPTVQEQMEWAARSEPRAEGLREALQAIIDLRVVVPDHPHGGVHPPYLEWVKVAEIVRAALAARPEPRCEMCARGDRDTHAQHMARSEPRAEGTAVPRRCIACDWNGAFGAEAHRQLIHPDRDDLTVIEQMGEEYIVRLDATPPAEGLREGDWLCPTCGTLFRFQPDAALAPEQPE